MAAVSELGERHATSWAGCYEDDDGALVVCLAQPSDADEAYVRATSWPVRIRRVPLSEAELEAVRAEVLVAVRAARAEYQRPGRRQPGLSVRSLVSIDPARNAVVVNVANDDPALPQLAASLRQRFPGRVVVEPRHIEPRQPEA